VDCQVTSSQVKALVLRCHLSGMSVRLASARNKNDNAANCFSSLHSTFRFEDRIEAIILTGFIDFQHTACSTSN
jgi:hypothetical protein